MDINIKKIILEEIDDFDWIKGVPDYNIYDPKEGYVYRWHGYSDLFDGPDNDGPVVDDVIVKDIVHYDNGSTEVEFDTVDSYWGDNHWDAIFLDRLIEKLKSGEIVFLRVED